MHFFLNSLTYLISSHLMTSHSHRNDRNDLCANGDPSEEAAETGGPISPSPPRPRLRPSVLLLRPVNRILLPPRMFGVFAQKAQMYTCGTSCAEGRSTQRPWSRYSHESLQWGGITMSVKSLGGRQQQRRRGCGDRTGRIERQDK